MPVFVRDNSARAAARSFAAAVMGGLRPFLGSVMIEVRQVPSSLNPPLPRSSQNEL